MDANGLKEEKLLKQIELGDANFKVQVKGAFSEQDAADYLPSPESEKLHVEVPLYEGPLDLLLHLIKKHSMDIFDIPIGLITQKYLEVLQEMRTLNLDIAGEFLLMAATLAQIKSRMLLPPDEQAPGEEEEAGVDPRAELVKRLLEYQTYKQVAQILGEKGKFSFDVFKRSLDHEIAYLTEAVQPEMQEVSVFKLIELFSKALEKASPTVVHAVKMERISVRARMNEMVEFLRLKQSLTFEDALNYFGIQTKNDIIVTFLSILELTRMKLLRVAQEGTTIILKPVQENLQASDGDLLQDLNNEELPN